MNNITTIIIAIAAIVVIGCKPTKVANNRDYAYEAYCDSLWEANPNYYLDVLVERAFDDQCTGANPAYPLMSEIKEIFLNAYNGIV